MALKCSECFKWGCPNRNLATDECTVDSFKTTTTNTLKEMTREDVINTEEYQLTKLSMEWLAEHDDDDDVDALDGYEAGYKQALEHPTGGELLHVLNKGHKQGYKDAIEDACELLAKMVWEITYEDLEGNSTHHCDKIEFIEALRKAMEEQQ